MGKTRGECEMIRLTLDTKKFDTPVLHAGDSGSRIDGRLRGLIGYLDLPRLGTGLRLHDLLSLVEKRRHGGRGVKTGLVVG